MALSLLRRSPAVRHAARRLALAAACMAALASPARAHAHLRRSDPAAGAMVAAPSVLRLWFTEGVERSYSRVTLTDVAGRGVPLGPVATGDDGSASLRASIDTALPDGDYTVRWKVAGRDGHPASGSFTFHVRNAPAADTAARAAAASGQASVVAPPLVTVADSTAASPLSPSWVIVRTLGFAALLALLGAVVFRVAVAPRLDWIGTDAGRVLLRRLAAGATAAALLYALAAALRLWLQDRMLSGDASTSAAHLRSIALETQWGAIWRAQLLTAVAAVAGGVLAMRRSSGWVVAGVAAGALAIASAMGGHAGAADDARALGIATDALHIAAAAGWLGSLLWLAVIGYPASRAAPATRRERAASLVRAFSPTALGAAAIVAASGTVSAWLRLGSVRALIDTGYGQVLLVKLLLVAGVAATGFYNWRVLQPALDRESTADRLDRAARVELAFGALVLVATAVLVGMATA